MPPSRRALRAPHLLVLSVLLGGGGCDFDIPAFSSSPAPAEPTARPAQPPAPAKAPASSPPSVATARSGAADASQGGCVHRYLPLRRGYAVTYDTSIPDGDYTLRVASDGPGLANLEYSSRGVVVEHAIRCEGGELREDAYLDLSRFYVSNAPNVQVTAARTAGAYLPKDLRVGTRWSATFEGESTMAEQNMSARVVVQGEKEAVGTESVTTPAGTFADALKIKATYTIRTTLLSPTRMDLPPMVVNSQEWMVEGKGMVKSSSSIGGQSYSIQATAITTP